MKILAFLQNAYTRDEATAHKLESQFADPTMVERMQTLRKWGLFEGANYTGCTILRIFGQKLCDSIWWENASPQWGWRSHHKFPADHDHILRLLNAHQPELVVAFGKVATDALTAIQGGLETPAFTLLSSPHPAARDPQKYDKMRGILARIEAMEVVK